MLLWWPKDLHDARKLFLFILTREDWISREKLRQDTSQTPHVNWQSIGHAQDDFRRPVETRLNVGIDLFVLEAGRSKVDDLDVGFHRMGEEDVFGLEIAVDDLVALQQAQAAEHLLGEGPDEAEREATEVVRLDEFVQIHAEQLCGDAKMATEVEGLGKVDEAVLVVGVLQTS